MNLTKKEIEQLILTKTFVGRVASFTREHPDGEPAVRGATGAARAIHERLKEDVVWNVLGFVVHGKKTSVVRIAGSGANLYPSKMLDCDDGQDVIVTVKKI